MNVIAVLESSHSLSAVITVVHVAMLFVTHALGHVRRSKATTAAFAGHAIRIYGSDEVDKISLT